MKKLLIIIVVLILPLPVFAKSGWTLLQKENTLSLSGKCPGDTVRVDLFSGNDRDPIYTSGAPCLDGNFTFSDDLVQWKSLSDGEYTVVVDNDRKNTKNIFLKRPVEQRVVTPVTPVAPVVETSAPAVVSPEIKFLGAFTALEQSILDMRQWLSETNYPTLVKSSLNMALDGLDMAVSKVSDLVLFAQSGADTAGNTPPEPASSSPVDPVAETPATETPAEPTEPPVPDPAAPHDTGPVDAVDSTPTTSVPEAAVSPDVTAPTP